MNILTSYIVVLLCIVCLTACEGNGHISAQTSGQFEMTTDYSYEETQNGKVVKTKEEHQRTGGAFEDEVNVEFGNKLADSVSKKVDNVLTEGRNCVSAMNGDSFQNVKYAIEEEIMDRKKLQKAKLLVNEHCLSSRQVANIMDLLMMDKYKVEFARFAYNRTTDLQNFDIVKQTLKFSNSKQQIDSMGK